MQAETTILAGAKNRKYMGVQLIFTFMYIQDIL